MSEDTKRNVTPSDVTQAKGESQEPAKTKQLADNKGLLYPQVADLRGSIRRFAEHIQMLHQRRYAAKDVERMAEHLGASVTHLCVIEIIREVYAAAKAK